jgi:hypothetical protein
MMLRIMPFSIMTHSIKFVFVTLSITTLFVMLSIIMKSVTSYL